MVSDVIEKLEKKQIKFFKESDAIENLLHDKFNVLGGGRWHVTDPNSVCCKIRTIFGFIFICCLLFLCLLNYIIT